MKPTQEKERMTHSSATQINKRLMTELLCHSSKRVGFLCLILAPEVSLLSLLLEDEGDDGAHEELVDHSAHSKEQVDAQNSIPTQAAPYWQQ